MARFSFDEGTSCCKRKTNTTEKEEASKKRICEEETSESEEASESLAITVSLGDYTVGDEEDEVVDSRVSGNLDDDAGLRSSNTDGEYKFSIESDVLDCSICFEPLRPPIYQCTNGHIACSSCCPKLHNKCQFCSQPIGHQRCLAFEKVIESIKIPCKYAIDGCRTAIFFIEKASHEETCIHTPLFCPFSGCSFSSSKKLLIAHVNCRHREDSKKFTYNQPFKVKIKKNQSLMALLAENGRLFILLNRVEPLNRNMLSVIEMDAGLAIFRLSYRLGVRIGESSLRLMAPVEKMIQWSGVHPEKDFLVVPDSLPGEIHVNVLITGIWI